VSIVELQELEQELEQELGMGEGHQVLLSASSLVDEKS